MKGANASSIEYPRFNKFVRKRPRDRVRTSSTASSRMRERPHDGGLSSSLQLFVGVLKLLPVAVRQTAVERRVAAMAIGAAPEAGRAAIVSRAKLDLVSPTRQRAGVRGVATMAPRSAP